MGITAGRWIDLVLLICLSIPVSVIDIREKKIPDILIIIGFIVFLLTRIILIKEVSIWLIIDPAIGFLCIFCLWFITKGGIGLGDAKLSGLLGLILGLLYWGIALFIASLSGLIAGSLLIFFKKMEKKEPIPFGPFLVFGGIVSYIMKYFIMKDITGLW